MNEITEEDIKLVHPDYPTQPEVLNMMYREHVQQVADHFAGKPREVTTVEELDTLPSFSVIHIKQGMTLEKMSDGWYQACIAKPYQPWAIWLPARILFNPSTEEIS